MSTRQVRWLRWGGLALLGACGAYDATPAPDVQIEVCLGNAATACPAVEPADGSSDDASEASEASVSGDDTADAEIDGAIETIPLQVASLTSLRAGDPLTIVVSFGGGQAGVGWPGVVSATGAIQLAGDAGATQPITFTSSTSTQTVSALATSPGAGTISASIAGGPQSTVGVQVGSALVGVRRVRFVGQVGLGAQNELTVCSTHVGGMVSVTPSSDASAIVPAAAALTSPTDTVCPAGYSGEAVFEWTGYDPVASVTIIDPQLGTTTQSFATLGAAGSVVGSSPGSDVWLCRPAPPPASATDADAADDDAGPDAAAADSGDAAGAIDADPPDAASADAAAPDAASSDAAGASSGGCSGTWLIEVVVTLVRDSFGPAMPAASPGAAGTPGAGTAAATSVIAGAALSFQVPTGAVVTPPTVTTDREGQASFEVAVPANLLGAATSVPISILVDGRFDVSVLLEQQGVVALGSP